MRNDILMTFEDFERVAEDYFHLIPPDTDSFKLDLCVSWEYDEVDNVLKFYFDDDWLMDEFYDEILDCPKLNESFGIDDMFESYDRENKIITIEGKEGGL